MDLSSLLSPMSVTEFTREHWEHRPVRIGPARLDRVTQTLTLADVDRIVSEGRIPAELLLLNTGGSDVAAARYCTEHALGKGRTVRRVVMERVYELVAGGHTMVLGEVQACHAPLGDLCDDIARGLGGRVHANVYVTPPRSQGFGAHYDCHDVLVLQLHGRKRWRLYRAPHPLPLRDETFSRVAPEVGEVGEEVVLEPGDLLYVPRGWVHEAAALDSLSVHTTIGVTVPRWSDFLLELVGAAALDALDLRRALHPAQVLEPTTPATIDAVRALLRRLAEPATVARAQASLARRHGQPPRPGAHERLVDLAAAAHLDADAVCSPRMALTVHHDAEAGTVELQGTGLTFVLPDVLREELEHIASQPRFRVRDLPGELDEEDKVRLAKRLLTAGLLRHHPRVAARVEAAP